MITYESRRNIRTCHKSARKNYPLTLEELGEKVGVSHAFLSRVENNKITPNDKLLVKIANVLDFNETQDF